MSLVAPPKNQPDPNDEDDQDEILDMFGLGTL